MKTYSCNIKVKVLLIILTAVAVLSAFIHSSMPGNVSEDESGSVLLLLQRIIDFLGINVEITEYAVRKTAHFCEYTVIGAMMMSCAFSFNNLKPYKYSINLMFCGLLTAVCDETIQLGVDGRAGMVTDVLLDFSGVIFGMLIMLAVFLIYGKRFRSKNKEKE